MQNRLQQLRGIVHFVHSGVDTASRKTEDAYLKMSAAPVALVKPIPVVGTAARQAHELNTVLTTRLHKAFRGLNRSIENVADDVIGSAQAYLD